MAKAIKKKITMKKMTKKTNINSIQGLGNDIIEIDRVQKAIDRHGQDLLERLFTLKEQKYCFKYKNASLHFAGRFAAKEAIAKALGCGIGSELHWHDIEIINDKTGKPLVSFSPSVMKKFGDPTVLLSISHCEKYAMATAILL